MLYRHQSLKKVISNNTTNLLLMEPFYLEATKSTFGLNFDPEQNLIEFKGNSYPTNAMEFFKEPVEWMRNFLSSKKTEALKVVFDVQYFNTSSSKYIFNMLELFDEYYKAYGNIDIVWMFDEDDEDIFESWKSLILQLNVPYRTVEANEQN